MVIIKHCDELGLEATRELLNTFKLIEVILSMSSVSEMNKFYQMCRKGLQCNYVKVEANIDESDQMIEIIINSLKLRQTKVKLIIF